MIGKDILKIKGQKIKDIVAFLPDGYDCGFSIVTENGTQISVEPYAMTEYSARIKIKGNGIAIRQGGERPKCSDPGEKRRVFGSYR